MLRKSWKKLVHDKQKILFVENEKTSIKSVNFEKKSFVQDDNIGRIQLYLLFRGKKGKK